MRDSHVGDLREWALARLRMLTVRASLTLDGCNGKCVVAEAANRAWVKACLFRTIEKIEFARRCRCA